MTVKDDSIYEMMSSLDFGMGNEGKRNEEVSVLFLKTTLQNHVFVSHYSASCLK